MTSKNRYSTPKTVRVKPKKITATPDRGHSFMELVPDSKGNLPQIRLTVSTGIGSGDDRSKYGLNILVTESGFLPREGCIRGWSGWLVWPNKENPITEVEDLAAALEMFLRLVIP